MIFLKNKKSKLKSETNVPKFVPTSCWLCLFLKANSLAQHFFCFLPQTHVPNPRSY
jgi:hypothetical protein